MGRDCYSCVDISVRASWEACLHNHLYWKAGNSTELHQGMETLQSLAQSTGRSFDNGPPSQKCTSLRTTLRAGQIHHQLGAGLPAVQRTGNPPPVDVWRRRKTLRHVVQLTISTHTIWSAECEIATILSILFGINKWIARQIAQEIVLITPSHNCRSSRVFVLSWNRRQLAGRYLS